MISIRINIKKRSWVNFKGGSLILFSGREFPVVSILETNFGRKIRSRVIHKGYNRVQVELWNVLFFQYPRIVDSYQGGIKRVAN